MCWVAGEPETCMDERTATSELPPHPELVSRRRALGSLGAGGLALLVSTLPASAFLGFGRREKLDFSSLPSEWVRRQGTLLDDYGDYLSRQRLKRVTPLQVIASHAKRHGSVWNTLPPKRMWGNITPTLKIIDRMALELGESVEEVVSVYRSPAYNARCAGAARGSWHKSNVAVDVVFPSRPSKVAALARSLRSKGHFKGGVGRYYGFTHVDTRGRNFDW